jgi:hypothetical protein
MIQIPEDVFFQITLKTGSVYYYFNPELKKTEEPHYFVVLAKTERIILVCATSQFKKRIEWAKRRKISLDTLVSVNPDKDNGLKKPSLFDCNFHFEETESSLKQKHREKPIKIKGSVSDNDLKKMINAVKKSPLIPSEIKDLL